MNLYNTCLNEGGSDPRAVVVILVEPSAMASSWLSSLGHFLMVIVTFTLMAVVCALAVCLSLDLKVHSHNCLTWISYPLTSFNAPVLQTRCWEDLLHPLVWVFLGKVGVPIWVTENGTWGVIVWFFLPTPPLGLLMKNIPNSYLACVVRYAIFIFKLLLIFFRVFSVKGSSQEESWDTDPFGLLYSWVVTWRINSQIWNFWLLQH